MNRSQRYITSTILACVLIGAGAPLASAGTQAHSHRTTATSVQAGAPSSGASATLPASLNSGTSAKGADAPAAPAGKGSAAARAALKLLKKYGGSLLAGAKKAAKKGVPAFKKWAGDLPWYHPVRLAITALGGEALLWLVEALS